jgi:hypothetical protein
MCRIEVLRLISARIILRLSETELNRAIKITGVISFQLALNLDEVIVIVLSRGLKSLSDL